MKKVALISTTTHDYRASTSVAMLSAVGAWLHDRASAEVRLVDASQLHIVRNLSCYASGAKDCGHPKAGPYRCWAHYESLKDPAKYGGVDEMPVIYDTLAWADIVVWGTSVRWGSHSALMQKIIERMDTLENRCATYGEPNPLRGKVAGVVVAGLHWKAKSTAKHLTEVFSAYGFAVPLDAALWWQRTADPCFEHPDLDLPYVEHWLASLDGAAAVDRFGKTLWSGR
jgi:multimeric flavodoxin WrbA